jgi:hypothetical protein
VICILKSPIHQNSIIIISNSMVILKDTSHLRELREDFSPTYIITPYIIAKVNELIDEDSNWRKELASFCGMHGYMSQQQEDQMV